MATINRSTREIRCKIVYYGPGGSGKTSNIRHVCDQLPPSVRDNVASIATAQGDRTLFFDFLPLELGDVAGFNVRLQLYTVPGEFFYEATRRLVLEDADGVIFVADSQKKRIEENLESLQDLHANLALQDIDASRLPLVMQYNKRDLEEGELMSVDELEEILNFRSVPSVSARAIEGGGVFESLHAITDLVFRRLTSDAGAKA